MGLHIVIVGNPVDGFEFYGPFKTAEDANEWADNSNSLRSMDWWAAPLLGIDALPKTMKGTR